MHPYEMQRLLRQRHKDELLALKRGSLYHAINRLLKLVLIEPVGTGRTGRRPERTTYRITAAGGAALMRWIQEMISVPLQESSEFTAAMSFLVHLTPREAVPKLEERMHRLERNIADLETSLAALVDQAKRINLIEGEFQCAMRKAELAWVRGLVNELRSGEFIWHLKRIVREAKAANRMTANAGKAR